MTTRYTCVRHDKEGDGADMLSESMQARNRQRPSQLEQVVGVDAHETVKIM
jgi:hypothetical protein